jgi:hypothetical protein
VPGQKVVCVSFLRSLIWREHLTRVGPRLKAQVVQLSLQLPDLPTQSHDPVEVNLRLRHQGIKLDRLGLQTLLQQQRLVPVGRPYTLDSLDLARGQLPIVLRHPNLMAHVVSHGFLGDGGSKECYQAGQDGHGAQQPGDSIGDHDHPRSSLGTVNPRR